MPVGLFVEEATDVMKCWVARVGRDRLSRLNTRIVTAEPPEQIIALCLASAAA